MSKRFNISEILNYLYVIYAFTLPLSRASAAIATALILLLFLFSPERKKWIEEFWRMPAAKWIVIFVAYYFISLLFTTTPEHTPEEWKEGIRYLVPYLYLLPAAIMAVTMKKRYLPMILSAFLAGILVSEALSYLIFFGLWEKNRAIVSMANPTPFMHHIQYSTFLAFAALLLLDMMISGARRGYRIFYALFFVAVVGTLFLINGRTGQVAFLIGLFALGLMHIQNKAKALLLSSLLVLLVLGTAYGLSDNFRERVSVAQSDIHNMIDKGNYGTSLGYRVGVIMLAVPLIEKNPLLGTGVIDTIPLVRKEAAVTFPGDYWLGIANHFQNQYLQVLVEIGLIGLGLLLVMLYYVSRIPLQSGMYRNLKVILMSVFLFTMLSDIQLHIQFTGGLFALITGMLLAQSRIEQEEDRNVAKKENADV